MIPRSTIHTRTFILLTATIAIGKRRTNEAKIRGKEVIVRAAVTTGSTVASPVQLASTINQVVAIITGSARGIGGIEIDAVGYAGRDHAFTID
jgi:hypothetical protein